jgi:hypothetical protein
VRSLRTSRPISASRAPPSAPSRWRPFCSLEWFVAILDYCGKIIWLIIKDVISVIISNLTFGSVMVEGVVYTTNYCDNFRLGRESLGGLSFYGMLDDYL